MNNMPPQEQQSYFQSSNYSPLQQPPPALDHLTLAFDHAIQNLGSFLDSLAARSNSPQTVQLRIAGMNTMIIDYLKLLEACCVNDQMLKKKLQVIAQKLVALQSSGSLGLNHLAYLSQMPQSNPVPPPPIPGTTYLPPNGPPTVAPQMPNYYGSSALNPPPMGRNPCAQAPFDAARMNPAYRPVHTNFFPCTPQVDSYPIMTNSAPMGPMMNNSLGSGMPRRAEQVPYQLEGFPSVLTPDTISDLPLSNPYPRKLSDSSLIPGPHLL